MNLDFHFSEWAFLAKTDPEVFERRREQIIAEFLSQSGRHRQRLEVLQSRVDRERQLAATPQQAVVAISRLMCESLAELAGGMSSLTTDLRGIKWHPLLRSLARMRSAAAGTADVPRPSCALAVLGDGQGRRR